MEKEFINPEALSSFRSRAVDFYSVFREAMEEVIIGEPDAVEMAAALLLGGSRGAMTGILCGDTGTGKSKFIESVPKVLGLDKSQQVANIPHKLDLTPSQLMGKQESVTKSYSESGSISYEDISVKHKAMIGDTTKIILFDEINRTSPAALNAALKIIQDGYIEVYNDLNQLITVNDFDLILCSMNNYGTISTSDLDPAILSRLSMGVIMGKKQDNGLTAAAEYLWDNQGQITEEIKPHPNLYKFIAEDRKYVDRVPVSKEIIEVGKKVTKQANEIMADHGFETGDGRLSYQLIKIAKILSLINNHIEVNDKDIIRAAYFNLTGKLGALGVKYADLDSLKSDLSKVV